MVAFKPSARALDGQTIEVTYEIAKGYYLYRDKFKFGVDGEVTTLGTPQIPKGKEKSDDIFGKVEVYYKTVAIRLPVERASSGPLQLKLNVTSQGCADAGVCYPPQTQPVSLELPDPASAPPASAANVAVDGDESGKIAGCAEECRLLGQSRLLLPRRPGLVADALRFPDDSHPFRHHCRSGSQISRGRGFALSLAYVLGMAVTYAAAGVAAGMTGTLLAAALQSPWVLGAFALVFVVLSFSMFGFYELQLPTSLQSKLSEEVRPPAGRARHRRLRHGCPLGADRRPLRCRTAGRGAALHRPDRRCASSAVRRCSSWPWAWAYRC
jgi:thiol:disulfide interchange protein DsbD